jgi:pantetheine-phosphate adenylyltransferase
MGHLDVIRRASRLCGRLTVAVLNNPDKKHLFTLDERRGLMSQVCADFENVDVDAFSGLLIDLFDKTGADAVIRGARTVLDYEREFITSHALKSVNGRIETLILPANPAFLHISSSMVKEAAFFGCDVSGMVPEAVLPEISRKTKDATL